MKRHGGEKALMALEDKFGKACVDGLDGEAEKAPNYIRRRLGFMHKAFENIRAEVQSRGVPEMTMDEIDAEIAAARKERRKRKARELATP